MNGQEADIIRHVDAKYGGRLGAGLPSLSALMAMSAIMDRRRTPEEEEAMRVREIEYEKKRAEELRQLLIRQSICPGCESRLVRGKKIKREGYKREFTCTSCSNKYLI